jgi:hypothetical protein
VSFIAIIIKLNLNKNKTFVIFPVLYDIFNDFMADFLPINVHIDVIFNLDTNHQIYLIVFNFVNYVCFMY